MDQDRIVRLPGVMEATGLARSTVWGLIKQGKFPSPYKLSKRAVGWKYSDIANFISSLSKK